MGGTAESVAASWAIPDIGRQARAAMPKLRVNPFIVIPPLFSFMLLSPFTFCDIGVWAPLNGRLDLDCRAVIVCARLPLISFPYETCVRGSPRTRWTVLLRES